MKPTLSRALRTAGRIARRAARDYLERRPPRTGRRGPAAPRTGPVPRVPAPGGATTAVEYPVPRLGLPDFWYEPRHDDQPDPGEVVWTWVPYDEDASRGKDRPVLVLARTGSGLVASQLTSRDHDRDADDEARHGRYWIDVGSGGWDARGRPSEARLDRLLLVDPGAVRREGGALGAERYLEVVAALRAHHHA